MKTCARSPSPVQKSRRSDMCLKPQCYGSGDRKMFEFHWLGSLPVGGPRVLESLPQKKNEWLLKNSTWCKP